MSSALLSIIVECENKAVAVALVSLERADGKLDGIRSTVRIAMDGGAPKEYEMQLGQTLSRNLRITSDDEGQSLEIAKAMMAAKKSIDVALVMPEMRS